MSADPIAAVLEAFSPVAARVSREDAEKMVVKTSYQRLSPTMVVCKLLLHNGYEVKAINNPPDYSRGALEMPSDTAAMDNALENARQHLLILEDYATCDREHRMARAASTPHATILPASGPAERPDEDMMGLLGCERDEGPR